MVGLLGKRVRLTLLLLKQPIAMPYFYNIVQGSCRHYVLYCTVSYNVLGSNPGPFPVIVSRPRAYLNLHSIFKNLIFNLNEKKYLSKTSFLVKYYRPDDIKNWISIIKQSNNIFILYYEKSSLLMITFLSKIVKDQYIL